MAEFSCQVGALRAAVALASAVTERRNTVPILSHLNLLTAAGRLTLVGSNAETWITASVAGEGEIAPTTAAAARLSGLLDLLPEEETVTLAPAKAGHLEVRVGTMRAKLFSLDAVDFPAIPNRTFACRWSIAAGKLRALFDRTAFCISTEETRYYLNGVFLTVHDEGAGRRLYAQATDGHRLMVASEDLPEEGEPQSIIVPRQVVNALRGFLARMPPGQVVRVASDGATMDVQAASWRMIFKGIDGKFPDVWRVIPTELVGEPIKVLDPRRLADALRTVRAISDDRSQPVRIGNDEGAAIILDARQAENGDCSLFLPAEVATWATNARPKQPAGFQARYMIDICGIFRSGFEVRVDAEQPWRITGPEGTAVLMPMRV